MAPFRRNLWVPFIIIWITGLLAVLKHLVTVEIHYTAVTMLSYGLTLGLQLASYNGSKPMWFCQITTSYAE